MTETFTPDEYLLAAKIARAEGSAITAARLEKKAQAIPVLGKLFKTGMGRFATVDKNLGIWAQQADGSWEILSVRYGKPDAASLTEVEVAPKREPRTWERLHQVPNGVKVRDDRGFIWSYYLGGWSWAAPNGATGADAHPLDTAFSPFTEILEGDQ